MQTNHLSNDELRKLIRIAEQMATKHAGWLSERDDIVQGAMIKLMKRRDPKPPTTEWMRKVVRSVAIDIFRSRRLELQYIWLDQPDDLSFICETVDSDTMYAESGHSIEIDEVQEAIDTLTEPLKEVLLLYADGHTYLEIAEITAQKPGTVRSRLYYARKKLEELLVNIPETITVRRDSELKTRNLVRSYKDENEMIVFQLMRGRKQFRTIHTFGYGLHHKIWYRVCCLGTNSVSITAQSPDYVKNTIADWVRPPR